MLPPVRAAMFRSAIYWTTKFSALLWCCRTSSIRTRHFPSISVVFNAIGDADLCQQALDRAVTLMDRTLAPVINAPAAVLATGRAANARRLAEVPGVVAPLIANFSRETLAGTDAPAALDRRGLQFPLLLRAPGFHNGQHFLLVGTPPNFPPRWPSFRATN